VWTDLIKMKTSAIATIDRKFLAVLSQRKATCLNRLICKGSLE